MSSILKLPGQDGRSALHSVRSFPAVQRKAQHINRVTVGKPFLYLRIETRDEISTKLSDFVNYVWLIMPPINEIRAPQHPGRMGFYDRLPKNQRAS